MHLFKHDVRRNAYVVCWCCAPSMNGGGDTQIPERVKFLRLNGQNAPVAGEFS